MRFRLFLVTLYLPVVISCTLPAGPPAVNPYVNSTYGYRITAPAAWIVAEAGGTGGASFLGPYDYLVNIVTTAEETSDTLLQYYEKEKERLLRSGLWVSTAIDQEGATQVDGYDARVIDYSYFMADEITAREIVLVENGVAYTITYQAQTAHYQTYFDEFEEALDSFELF
jgi:hypothetical protein